MTETIINLKPQAEWRAGMTLDALVAEMDQALQMPGVSNAWTMPIKNRTDMLATGIRTPVGVKVFGKDLGEIDILARQIESAVRTVPGTPACTGNVPPAGITSISNLTAWPWRGTGWPSAISCR